MSIEDTAARYVIEMEHSDSLTPRRRKKIERWLAENPKHRETFNVLRATWRYTEKVLRRSRQVKPS